MTPPFLPEHVQQGPFAQPVLVQVPTNPVGLAGVADQLLGPAKPKPTGLAGAADLAARKPRKTKAWIAADRRRARKRALARRRAQQAAARPARGQQGVGKPPRSKPGSGAGGASAGRGPSGARPAPASVSVPSGARATAAARNNARQVAAAAIAQAVRPMQDAINQARQTSTANMEKGKRLTEAGRGEIQGLINSTASRTASMLANAQLANANAVQGDQSTAALLASQFGNAVGSQAFAQELASGMAGIAGNRNFDQHKDAAALGLQGQVQQDFFQRGLQNVTLTNNAFSNDQMSQFAAAKAALGRDIAMERGKLPILERQFGREDAEDALTRLTADRAFGLQNAQLSLDQQQFRSNNANQKRQLTLQERQMQAEQRQADQAYRIEKLKAELPQPMSETQYKAIDRVLNGEVKDVRKKVKSYIRDKKGKIRRTKDGKARYNWKYVSETSAGVGKATSYDEAVRGLTPYVGPEQAAALAAGYFPRLPDTLGNLYQQPY